MLTILQGHCLDRLLEIDNPPYCCLRSRMPDSKGRFKPGEHWRPQKPHWDRDWLFAEYVTKQRSCASIADEMGCKGNAIAFWLKKHGIKGRTTSEIRKFKKWGSVGDKNPMFGRRGPLNPRWKGGLTPARQRIYASAEWRKFSREVRKRDKVCRLCASDTELQIHHIDPYSDCPLLVMDLGNVILLCGRCHRGMQRKEKRWKRKLLQILKGGK